MKILLLFLFITGFSQAMDNSNGDPVQAVLGNHDLLLYIFDFVASQNVGEQKWQNFQSMLRSKYISKNWHACCSKKLQQLYDKEKKEIEQKVNSVKCAWQAIAIEEGYIGSCNNKKLVNALSNDSMIWLISYFKKDYGALKRALFVKHCPTEMDTTIKATVTVQTLVLYFKAKGTQNFLAVAEKKSPELLGPLFQTSRENYGYFQKMME